MESEVKEIQKLVQAISDDSDSFELEISNSLLLDGKEISHDFAMAIILDILLAKDFLPDGFEDIPGGRTYKYKKNQ